MATNYPLLQNNLGRSMSYGVNAPNTMLDSGYTNPTTMGQPMGSTGMQIGALGSQPSSSGSALQTAGGILGTLNPIVGAGLGVAGFFADKSAQAKAEKRQEEELNKLRGQREASRQRYISELDQDSARRNMILRGQVANTPAYQAMMSNQARINQAQNSLTTDNLQKQGLGSNAGLSAAVASNNMSNIGRNVTMGAANQMNTANRVYGGLNPSALTTAPENIEMQRQQNMYNEAGDYGSNLAPIFNLGSTATKGTISDMYRDKLRDDVRTGFAIGKSGGNV